MAKGFKKGDEVTFINTWDDKGTFSYTHAVVHSCGKKQMVLTGLDGKELGRHFHPAFHMPGMMRPCYSAIPYTDKRDIVYWNGTVNRLSDEGAEKLCIAVGEAFVAARRVECQNLIEKHRDSVAYCRAMELTIKELHEGRAIKR